MIARRWLVWAPVVAYMAAIFYVSSLSNPLPELTSAASDKTLHALAYSGLAYITARAVAEEGRGWTLTLLAAVIIASLYGATDEWHQLYVPGRASDIHDWFADTGGSAAGAVVHSVVALLWTAQREPEPAQN